MFWGYAAFVAVGGIAAGLVFGAAVLGALTATAIVMMTVTLGISIVFFVRPAWLQAALAAFGVGLAAWMYRLPSRDR